MTIIKSFPRGHFYRDKDAPLSPSMVIGLKKAFARQKRRKPFGPVDIRSLHLLIERGLISFTYYKSDADEKEATWYVTKKGMRIFYSINRKKMRPDSDK